MLHDNIDLTENRIFGALPVQSSRINHRSHFDLDRELIVLSTSLNHEQLMPWERRKLHHDCYSTIIPTGSVKDIRKQKWYHEGEMGESCHCCGVDLTRIPYQAIYSLCRYCNDQMEMQTHKTLYTEQLDTMR
jgi:hypothetical protein